MSEHFLIHHTFTIERRYGVPVADVFAAWSDSGAKRRWFAAEAEHTLDFSVGGLETVRAVGDNGKRLDLESRYVDIVAEERIVYVSTLSAEDEVATTSITSVELRPESDATLLVLTESGVFLDGQEEPSWREHGTADWLTKLGSEVESAGR